jgi:hypothetical protein
MLNCRETAELLSQSLEKNLSLWTRIKIRIHLMMCAFCIRFKKQMDFLHRTISDSREELNSLPLASVSDMPEDLKKRIQANLQQHPGS